MNMKTLPTVYSPTIDKAIGFAAKKHANQRRKIGDLPYIVHPMGVAAILLQMGSKEEIVAAALLHDTIEDCGVKLEEIIVRFGQEVGDIVAGCTELPKKQNTWEKRKREMIDRLRHAPLEVKLVVAADKFHNLYHVWKSIEEVGTAVWDRFSRGPEQQAWYYRSALASILSNLPDESRSYPIFEQLEIVVGTVFDGISSHSPS